MRNFKKLTRGILFFILVLFQFSCSDCNCGTGEPSFTAEELSHLPSSVPGKSLFIHNDEDSAVLNNNIRIYTDEPMCCTPGCCVCPDDYTKYGVFQQYSNQVYDPVFRVEISKHKNRFYKYYYIENFNFSDFDSSLENYNVSGTVYPTVLYKEFEVDPFNYKPDEMAKIYYVEDIGLVKYELENGEVWELRN